MNWWGGIPGSGFIPIIIYQNNVSSQMQDFNLLTENGDIILTESGSPIEIE